MVFHLGGTCYASSKFYQYSFREVHPEKTISWVWKSKCIPKIKFFACLLLNDKLNTRNMLRRRNKFLEDGYNCSLCPNGLEDTMEHLFFDCPSATNHWFALGIQWNEDSNIHQKILLAEQ
jgi:hypothetical protein